MNLTIGEKTTRHHQFAGSMPADGGEHVVHASQTSERRELGDVALKQSCLTGAPHCNCRKPDRYAKDLGQHAAKAKAKAKAKASGRKAQCEAASNAANRRLVIRRNQPSVAMTQRKTGTEGFLPLAVASEFIALIRNDRRKAKALQATVIHRHAPHEGSSANDSEWDKADEELRESQEDLRRLSAQLLTIQENERQRIAADLHDGIGQSLNLIKMSVESALLLVQKGAHQEVIKSLQQMIPNIKGAMAELRGITMDLRPAMLNDLGILPTLSWFFREFETASSDMKIEKDFSISESDVPVHLRTTIFRILQEAMNNIVKHAQARRIKICLKKTDGMLQCSIEDDGQGFDPAAMSVRDGSAGGMGLLTMKERARSSAGIFQMKSIPGQGTQILISWRHMDEQFVCEAGGEA